MTMSPRKSMPIPSKTWLFHAKTSLPLGPDFEASLAYLKRQPKGVPDYFSHDPTDALHQWKPFIHTSLFIHKVIRLECT